MAEVTVRRSAGESDGSSRTLLFPRCFCRNRCYGVGSPMSRRVHALQHLLDGAAASQATNLLFFLLMLISATAQGA